MSFLSSPEALADAHRAASGAAHRAAVRRRERAAQWHLLFLLVVVLGGISLSGGRGGVRNVLVGTLLVGVLLNGMTILDIAYTTQNLIKSLILLLAITVDSFINPRDEQTAQQQQGDI